MSGATRFEDLRYLARSIHLNGTAALCLCLGLCRYKFTISFVRIKAILVDKLYQAKIFLELDSRS